MVPVDPEIKAALTDRQQWALFIGHLVLGLVVIGPIMYFSTKAVAEAEAQEAADGVERKVELVQAALTAVTVTQATVTTKIEGLERQVQEIKSGQGTISDKLDRLIERGAHAPNGGGYR